MPPWCITEVDVLSPDCTLEVVAVAGPESVPSLRMAAGRIMGALSVAESMVGRVELGVDESCNAIVAGRSTGSAPELTLLLRIRGRHVETSVTAAGEPLPERDLVRRNY